jgi:hypothetical protein
MSGLDKRVEILERLAGGDEAEADVIMLVSGGEVRQVTPEELRDHRRRNAGVDFITIREVISGEQAREAS